MGGRWGARLARHDDAEGLSAEHTLAGEGQQGGIDGNGELHGQLRRNDAGDYHATVQEELEARPVHLLCPDPPWALSPISHQGPTLPLAGGTLPATTSTAPHQASEWCYDVSFMQECRSRSSGVTKLQSTLS